MRDSFSKYILTFSLVLIGMLLCVSCKSPEERELESAQEASEHARENAASADAEYNLVLTQLDELNRLQNEIAALPEGSDEQKRLIAENNRIVNELIEKYPELADSVVVN